MQGVSRVLIDGVPDTAVPVTDRAFQYGDGLFETIRLVAGQLSLWRLHRERLESGARTLGIPLDLQCVEQHCAVLTQGIAAGVVRITVSRGDSLRGYAPLADAHPRIVCALYPAAAPDPRPYVQGVRVRLCDTRLAEQPRLAGLKHLNRLEQVLARQEWSTSEFAEGLMLDVAGRLIEGTFTNVFLVLDDRICTPRLDRCGVAGVMRRYLLEQRPGMDGHTVSECDLWPRDIEAARECFVTNSLIGIWPVHTIVIDGAARQLTGVTMGRQISAEVERRLGFTNSN
jgi:4-amino-4-deoxychorismate lyase